MTTQTEPRTRFFITDSDPLGDLDITVPLSVIYVIEHRNTALTADTLGDLLGVAPMALYQLVKQGKMPAMVLNGQVRFDPETTADWLRELSHRTQRLL